LTPLLLLRTPLVSFHSVSPCTSVICSGSGLSPASCISRLSASGSSGGSAMSPSLPKLSLPALNPSSGWLSISSGSTLFPSKPCSGAAAPSSPCSGASSPPSSPSSPVSFACSTVAVGADASVAVGLSCCVISTRLGGSSRTGQSALIYDGRQIHHHRPRRRQSW